MADDARTEIPAEDGTWVVRPRGERADPAEHEAPALFERQSQVSGSEIASSTLEAFTDQQLEAVREYLVQHVPVDILPATSRAPNRATVIRNTIEEAVKSRNDLAIPESRATYDALFRRLTGIGILQQYLDDPEVTEVVVQQWDQVKVERAGHMQAVADHFESPEDLYNTVRQFTALARQRIDQSKPIADFSLPDGTRVNAVIHPVTDGETYLTIRRAKNKAFPLEEFMRGGAMSEEMAQYLTWARRAHLSMIFAGATGSGKTTLMETLIGIVPDEEIVICEEVPELKPQHPNVRKMHVPLITLDVAEQSVDLNMLVRNALRMRPTVIVVGEVRGAEAEAMLIALTTGHRGGMTTIHADSAVEACDKLAIYATMGERSAFIRLPHDLLMRTIVHALDVIVVLRRDYLTGRRVVWSIDELASYENGTFVLRNVFSARWQRADDGTLRLTWERSPDYRPSPKVEDQLFEATLRSSSERRERPSDHELLTMRRAVFQNLAAAKWGRTATYARELLAYRRNDPPIQAALALAEEELRKTTSTDDLSEFARPAVAEQPPDMMRALLERKLREIEATDVGPATEAADAPGPGTEEEAAPAVEAGADGSAPGSPALTPATAPAPSPLVEVETMSAPPAPSEVVVVVEPVRVDPVSSGWSTVGPAARYLGISPSTLRRAADLPAGIVPVHIAEKGVRWYAPTDLERYARTHRIGPFRDDERPGDHPDIWVSEQDRPAAAAFPTEQPHDVEGTTGTRTPPLMATAPVAESPAEPARVVLESIDEVAPSAACENDEATTGAEVAPEGSTPLEAAAGPADDRADSDRIGQADETSDAELDKGLGSDDEATSELSALPDNSEPPEDPSAADEPATGLLEGVDQPGAIGEALPGLDGEFYVHGSANEAGEATFDDLVAHASGPVTVDDLDDDLVAHASGPVTVDDTDHDTDTPEPAAVTEETRSAEKTAAVVAPAETTARIATGGASGSANAAADETAERVREMELEEGFAFQDGRGAPASSVAPEETSVPENVDEVPGPAPTPGEQRFRPRLLPPMPAPISETALPPATAGTDPPAATRVIRWRPRLLRRLGEEAASDEEPVAEGPAPQETSVDTERTAADGPVASNAAPTGIPPAEPAATNESREAGETVGAELADEAPGPGPEEAHRPDEPVDDGLSAGTEMTVVGEGSDAEMSAEESEPTPQEDERAPEDREAADESGPAQVGTADGKAPLLPTHLTETDESAVAGTPRGQTDPADVGADEGLEGSLATGAETAARADGPGVPSAEVAVPMQLPLWSESGDLADHLAEELALQERAAIKRATERSELESITFWLGLGADQDTEDPTRSGPDEESSAPVPSEPPRPAADLIFDVPSNETGTPAAGPGEDTAAGPEERTPVEPEEEGARVPVHIRPGVPADSGGSALADATPRPAADLIFDVPSSEVGAPVTGPGESTAAGPDERAETEPEEEEVPADPVPAHIRPSLRVEHRGIALADATTEFLLRARPVTPVPGWRVRASAAERTPRPAPGIPAWKRMARTPEARS